VASSAPPLVALVTGASAGIGQETALELLRRGFEVWLAVRPGKTAMAVAEAATRVPSAEGRVRALAVDLADLASVRACAQAFLAQRSRLHVIVNSAGLGGLSRTPEPVARRGGDVEGDMDDLVYRVNAVGHWLLTRLLWPALEAAAPSRVVWVSSVMHRWGAMEWAQQRAFEPGCSRYADSKLACAVLAAEVSRRGSSSGVVGIAVNPGAVNSQIWYRGQLGPKSEHALRALFTVSFLTPAQGAATSVAAATDDTYAQVAPAEQGAYYLAPYWSPRGAPLPFELHGPFAGPQLCTPHPAVGDPAAGEALWADLEEACKPYLVVDA